MKNNPAIVSDSNLQVTPTKDSGYSGFGTHDYVVNGEITVTITLAEYRELVGAKANAEKTEAIIRKMEVERKLADVTKELEEANKRICSLETTLAKLTMQNAKITVQEED